MAVEEACAWCGEWFVKKGNKKYCCKECSELADKRRTILRMRKNRNKNSKQNVPSLSLHDMVDLMMKIEKEQGKVVQYGDLQTMLYNGQLKEKDGVVE